MGTDSQNGSGFGMPNSGGNFQQQMPMPGGQSWQMPGSYGGQGVQQQMQASPAMGGGIGGMSPMGFNPERGSMISSGMGAPGIPEARSAPYTGPFSPGTEAPGGMRPNLSGSPGNPMSGGGVDFLPPITSTSPGNPGIMPNEDLLALLGGARGNMGMKNY